MIKVKVPLYILELYGTDLLGDMKPLNYLSPQFVIEFDNKFYRISNLDRSTGGVYLVEVINEKD